MTRLLADPFFIVTAILIVVTVILTLLVLWMYFKMRRFLIGVGSGNIEDSLSFVSGSLDDLKKFRIEMESYLKTVEKRLKKSVQSVHTVRFNPFQGQGAGGNQSFATAFLTEDGEGVVISSLYARDHVSVFSKPVKDGKSEHELSEEEAEALEKAREKLK
ncbi:MAG: DUF4446 family protein [Patescibacteria group bacterium]|nr:DUF4446 family protein [Patescibacteria group bacterium]MDE1967195.1 DUF4446 family protein [Patescibacteria group bacterium]